MCYCGVCPLPRPSKASAVELHKLWPSAVEPLRLRPSAVKAVEPPSCDNQRLNRSSFDQKRLNRSSVTDHSCHHKHQGRQDSFFLSPRCYKSLIFFLICNKVSLLFGLNPKLVPYLRFMIPIELNYHLRQLIDEEKDNFICLIVWRLK